MLTLPWGSEGRIPALPAQSWNEAVYQKFGIVKHTSSLASLFTNTRPRTVPPAPATARVIYIYIYVYIYILLFILLHHHRSPLYSSPRAPICSSAVIRNYYCYFLAALSEQTRFSFLNNVTRESSSTKILSLLNETDFFMFEMFNNKYNFSGMEGSALLSCIRINPFYLEFFNFLLVLLHQIFLFINFNTPSDQFLKGESKYILYNNNVFLSIFQIIYLVVCLFIWFRANFSNTLHWNLKKNFGLS